MVKFSRNMESLTFYRFKLYCKNGGIHLVCKPEDYRKILECTNYKPCYGSETHNISVDYGSLFVRDHKCVETKFNLDTTGFIDKRLYVDSNLYINPVRFQTLFKTVHKKFINSKLVYNPLYSVSFTVILFPDHSESLTNFKRLKITQK